MESKKSQGPSRATLVSSAVVVCAVLVGAAYFMRDEGVTTVVAPSSPAASALQPLFERCKGEPNVEVVDGLTPQDDVIVVGQSGVKDGTPVAIERAGNRI